MSNPMFRVFFSVLLLLLGFALGYWLSALPRLETYKLLNVAGLSYSFLGVLVLSELLAASARWKDVCVKFLAPAVLWFYSVFPLGAWMGAAMRPLLMHKPSSVARFFLVFFGYSLLPLSILNEVVVLPQLPFVKRDIETRWRWFGLFLLLNGVAFQLIAALLAIRGQ